MTASDQQAYDAAFKYVREQMAFGVPDAAIQQSLIAGGWEMHTAAAVVGEIRSQQVAAVSAGPALIPNYQSASAAKRPPARRRPSGGGSGSSNMMLGGVICLIGIVVTVGSYIGANSGRGGGGYIIAWGAIVFGAIRFFRGLIQSGSD